MGPIDQERLRQYGKRYMEGEGKPSGDLLNIQWGDVKVYPKIKQKWLLMLSKAYLRPAMRKFYSERFKQRRHVSNN